ncbi:MAG: TnpV protein [Lachnospiraceae bacterium]|nr:TnpV protein [Lachnospiraceae bacterium]
MDKYVFDNSTELWYELSGDYYIPCLTLPAEKEKPIGVYGQRHLRYLKDTIYDGNLCSK